MQGKFEEALALIEEALRVLKAEKLSRPFDRVELLTGLATVKLAIAERLEGSDRASAVRGARRVCRAALRCAKLHPLWLPQAHRLRGTASWLSGKKAAAQKSWQEGIAVAQTSAFPIERALTLMEMGHRTDAADLIEEAFDVFHDTGAGVFRAIALHALAEARGTSADTQSSIRDYTQAIAALEAVNADDDLARARAQLAFLENGSHESAPDGIVGEARADVVRENRRVGTDAVTTREE